MGYGASDRLYGKILFLGPIILFPFALIVFAFSSCNVRHRSEKRACRGGDVKACLYLGTYYADKAPGIIGFLMSYNEDAVVYLHYACKAHSVEACERMYTTSEHGADQAKNASIDLPEIADNMIWGCEGGHQTLCDDLWEMMDVDGDWVGRRAAMAFEKACAENNPEACFRLVIMHQQKLAGLQNIVDEVIPLLEKSCAANVYDSCKSVQVYRDRKAQLEAEAANGSAGSSGSGGAGSGSAAGSAGSAGSSAP